MCWKGICVGSLFPSEAILRGVRIFESRPQAKQLGHWGHCPWKEFMQFSWVPGWFSREVYGQRLKLVSAPGFLSPCHLSLSHTLLLFGPQ